MLVLLIAACLSSCSYYHFTDAKIGKQQTYVIPVANEATAAAVVMGTTVFSDNDKQCEQFKGDKRQQCLAQEDEIKAAIENRRKQKP